MLPDAIKNFIALFAKLPGIGPRQANRLAFHVLRKGNASIADLANVIGKLTQLQTCSQCFFPFEPNRAHNESKDLSQRLCHICNNPNRKQNVIAIIEKETDLLSLEKTKRFNGRYLVLGELAKDGILETDQKMRLNYLKSTIAKQFGTAEEIIIALNPSTIGDIEANLIVQELKPVTKKISRLGRGLPTGGEIEFADEDTLTGALDNRK